MKATQTVLTTGSRERLPRARMMPHGSEAELTCSEAGVIGPLVGLVGSLQALEAMKLLAGFGEPLVGRLLLIDALGTRIRELRVKRDPACAVCGKRDG